MYLFKKPNDEETPTVPPLPKDEPDLDDFTFTDSDTSNEALIPIIYVICKNGIPVTYCDAEHDAKKLMNKLAWDCKAEYVLTNSDYNYYLSINDPTCISLSRTYTNWILSYDMHLDEFAYFKISKNENLNI